jgi:hypothetical protein
VKTLSNAERVSWYWHNSSSYRERQKALRRARRQLQYRLINEYKARGCADCGEKDPVVLDLDHVRGKKVRAVAMMVGGPTDKLLDELQKCEPRCANCHRRVTARRRAQQVDKEPK